MAKKLSNKDKQEIQARLEAGESVSKIAKDLEYTEKVVVDYLTNVFQTFAKIQAEKKVELQKAGRKPIAKDLILNKTRDNKRGGVAVMTKEASEVTDSYFGRDSGLKNQDKDITARDTLPNDDGKAFNTRYKNAIAPSRVKD